MALNFVAGSSDRVTLGTATSIFPDKVLLCAWVYPTSFPGAGTTLAIIEKTPADFADYRGLQISDTGGIGAFMRRGSPSFTGIEIATDNLIQLNEWAFVAAQMDATGTVTADQKVFYGASPDAIVEASVYATQDPGSGATSQGSTEPLLIGNTNAASFANAFPGMIHWAGIFNLANGFLELELIREIARASRDGEFLPVAGNTLWTFLGGTAQQFDISGNSNHGTVTGAIQNENSPAEHGSFMPVAVTANAYSLTADSDSFAVTGTDASLKRALKLSASSGSFTITGTAATLTYAATDTVTVGSTSYQTMHGLQATAQAGHDSDALTDTEEYPSSTFVNFKDELLAKMSDLGLHALRLEFNFRDINSTGYAATGTTAIQPSIASAGQWHYDRIDRAMDAFITEYRAILAARGEQLHLTICFVDFDDAGYDAENSTSEYSLVVLNVIQHFYDTYGYLPDLIEPILEPGTGENTTNWTRAKVANNMVAAQALLASSGPSGAGSIPFMAPSLEDGSTTTSWMTDMTSANAGWDDITEIVSYHGYVRPDSTELAAIRDAAAAFGATTAMTEHIGADHLELYDDLTIARNSLWQQFTVAYPWPGWSDNGEQYFGVDTSTWAVSLNERTKYIRHYFRYIRRGAVMKSVTNSNSNFLGVPFVNPDGKYVVVINCLSSGTFKVAGLPAGTYCIRYTTGDGSSAPSAFDQALTPQTVNGSEDVSVVMPGAGVVTVYDGGFRSPLSAEAGSVTITGTSASLKCNRRITASAGSFTITGTDAELRRGITISAEAGSVSITGTDAALRVTRYLSVDAGAVSIDGTDAAFRRTFVLTVSPGEFTITGANATLTKTGSYSLLAEAGSIEITGSDAGLLVARKLAAEAGAYSIAGTNASLFCTRKLSVTGGAFTITGANATLSLGSLNIPVPPFYVNIGDGHQRLRIGAGEQFVNVGDGHQRLRIE